MFMMQQQSGEAAHAEQQQLMDMAEQHVASLTGQVNCKALVQVVNGEAQELAHCCQEWANDAQRLTPHGSPVTCGTNCRDTICVKIHHRCLMTSSCHVKVVIVSVDPHNCTEETHRALAMIKAAAWDTLTL